MPDQQPSQPETSRFHVLCSEIEEYDHLPELTQDHPSPTRLITGQDHELQLDEQILAGLVSP